MKQAEIKRKVKRGDYVYTLHAEIEKKGGEGRKDGFSQIVCNEIKVICRD
jgi:hypothetical protein